MFPPSFAADTLARQQIPWTLTAGAEIIRIVASDNDTGPNSGLVRYSLVDPPYPLSYGLTDGRDICVIDPVSGLITVHRDLQLDTGRLPQFLLTIKASDAGQPPRSALHTLNLVPIPIPVSYTHLTLPTKA